MSIGHDAAGRQLPCHVSRYYLLLWLVFDHTSSSTMMCYHRRCVRVLSSIRWTHCCNTAPTLLYLKCVMCTSQMTIVFRSNDNGWWLLTLLRSIISNKRVTNTSSFQFLGIQKQFSDSSHEEIRFSFKNVFTVDVRFELTTNDPWAIDDAICKGISPLGYW